MDHVAIIDERNMKYGRLPDRHIEIKELQFFEHRGNFYCYHVRHGEVSEIYSVIGTYTSKSGEMPLLRITGPKKHSSLKNVIACNKPAPVFVDDVVAGLCTDGYAC